MSIRLASQPRYPVRTLSGAPATGGGDCSDWGRPEEWPAMPTIGENEQAFVGLVGIHDTDNEPVTVRMQGNYTVDWGDGSSLQNVTSNVTAQHNYVFGTMPQAVTSLGYKCAIIKVTPQAGQNLTSIQLQYNPTGITAQLNGYATPWLELLVNAAFCTAMTFGGGGQVKPMRVRRVEIRKHALTSCAELFRAMSSLVSVPVFNTAGIQNFTNCYYECRALANPPLLDLSAATNLTNMHNSNDALCTMPPYNTPLVTTIGGMSQYTPSLHVLPAMNLSNVTSAANFAYYASALSRSLVTGMKVTHSYASCSLPAAAIDEIFTNLASGVTGQTITVTGNPGAATCNQSIATAKGWTVAI